MPSSAIENLSVIEMEDVLDLASSFSLLNQQRAIPR